MKKLLLCLFLTFSLSTGYSQKFISRSLQSAQLDLISVGIYPVKWDTIEKICILTNYNDLLIFLEYKSDTTFIVNRETYTYTDTISAGFLYIKMLTNGWVKKNDGKHVYFYNAYYNVYGKFVLTGKFYISFVIVKTKEEL